MSYFYRVYGLNIESEILVPELSILKEHERNNIDAKINYGVVCDEIKNLIKMGYILLLIACHIPHFY